MDVQRIRRVIFTIDEALNVLVPEDMPCVGFRVVDGKVIIDLIDESPDPDFKEVEGVAEDGKPYTEIPLKDEDDQFFDDAGGHQQEAPPAEDTTRARRERKPAVKPLAQRAGILCSQKGFWKFLEVDGEEAAADMIRARCGVASRSDIDGDPDASREFKALAAEYDFWLQPPI